MESEMDKITEIREIIARMRQNHGIASNEAGFSWPKTPLDAIQYFSLGEFAKDSWRLQELISWYDLHEGLICLEYDLGQSS